MALTLEQYSKEKGFPVKFLQSMAWGKSPCREPQRCGCLTWTRMAR